MDFADVLQVIAMAAIPLIFAITVHEAAHGYIAKYFGDPTAYMLGRVTLNPIRHIDPIGTIALPVIFLLLPGSFLFGWAKPVPVNFAGLRNPKRDMLWVAAAGPGANLIMLIFWVVMVKIGLSSQGGNPFATPMTLMGAYGVRFNTALMILNLLPLLPLDGGRILVSLLPRDLANSYARFEPYGMMVLILLLFTNVLSWILGPFFIGIVDFFGALFDVPLAQLIFHVP